MSRDDARFEIRPDKATLADDLARELVEVIGSATDEGGIAHVALTGGSMGDALLAALPDAVGDTELRWEQVHVWWSDERFVAADSDDRNDKPALPVLKRLGIPDGNVHSMATPQSADSLDDAAQAYAAELAGFAESATNGLSEEQPVPSFDALLLGVGPDGHVASLFPEHPAQNVTATTTVAVTDSPKPPPERVSLTFPALAAARRVWFTVAGSGKEEAVVRAITGEEDPWRCPASAVHGRLDTVWWLDDAAASGLPK